MTSTSDTGRLVGNDELSRVTGGRLRGAAAPVLICAESATAGERLAALLVEHGVELLTLGSTRSVDWEHFAPSVDEHRGARRHPPGAHRRPWTTNLATRSTGLRYLHLVHRIRPHGEDDDAFTRRRVAQWNWVGFLAWSAAAALTVAVEDLESDPDTTVQRVLAHLGNRGAAEPSEEQAPAAPVVAGATRAGLRPSGSLPAAQVSVIVVAHNEGENLPITIAGIRATVPDDVQIVVVDDQSTDGSALRVPCDDAYVVTTSTRGGVVGARNAGARAATGDVVVFADAHVDPHPGWLTGLVAALDQPGVACAAPVITEMNHRQARGFGFTWSTPAIRMHWLRGPHEDVHPVPFACGCLMAFRRDDFEGVGGFDAGLVRWGSEDAEIGLNLWRRGRATVVNPRSQVAHLFRPVGPYDVGGDLVIHNTLRVATTHLPTGAVTKVIEVARAYRGFASAYAQLVDSDVWERREQVSARARHDGAWFLDRFRIEGLR